MVATKHEQITVFLFILLLMHLCTDLFDGGSLRSSTSEVLFIWLMTSKATESDFIEFESLEFISL